MVIVNSRWEIVDDAAWTDDWVGISSGDIYEDDEAFGHYVAAWYPNGDKPAQILVTVVNEKLEGVLAVAFHCQPDDINSLRTVEPEAVPWEDDGVAFGPIARPGELGNYSRAADVITAAKEVISQDKPLNKYLLDPSISLTET